MHKLSVATATHVGHVREHNEDSYLADPELGLWVVSDGLGGHSHGEVASNIATRTITANIRNGVHLADAVEAAHQEITRHKNDMGATVVALMLNGNQYEIAWVGDSRAYLFDGKLQRLTRDHTFIQRLVDEGEMSAAEAQAHPDRSILIQALGSSGSVSPETVSGEIHAGDAILLCSDGLTDEVDEAQIANVLIQACSAQEKVEQLIKLALANGGKDNITVQFISTNILMNG